MHANANLPRTSSQRQHHWRAAMADSVRHELAHSKNDRVDPLAQIPTAQPPAGHRTGPAVSKQRYLARICRRYLAGDGPLDRYLVSPGAGRSAGLVPRQKFDAGLEDARSDRVVRATVPRRDDHVATG